MAIRLITSFTCTILFRLSRCLIWSIEDNRTFIVQQCLFRHGRRSTNASTETRRVWWAINHIDIHIPKHATRYGRVKVQRKELLAPTSLFVVVTVRRIPHRMIVLPWFHTNAKGREREQGRKRHTDAHSHKRSEEFRTSGRSDKIKQEGERERKTGSNCWCGDSWCSSVHWMTQCE